MSQAPNNPQGVPPWRNPAMPGIPGMPNIPGVPGVGGGGPGTPRQPQQRPSARPQAPQSRAVDVGPPPKVSSYYPGSITFIDLMARNRRKSAWLMALMIGLFGLVGVVIALAFTMGHPEVLWQSALMGGGAALVVGVLATIWSYYGGTSAILAMAGAKEVQPHDDPELFNVVDEMRIAAGVPMPRVYLIHDTALNAFAAGRDPQHAVVAITTGLREKLDRDELQGVIAHEVAHIRHYDIRFAVLMATLAGLIVFVCDGFLRLAWIMFRGAGRSNSKDKGGAVAAAAVVLIVAFVLYLIAPIVGFLIQMAFSRQREFLADAGAVELTRNPDGLIRALAKLGQDRDPLVDVANRGTAHMYIVNPLRRMHASGNEATSVFSSHPALHERIERLQALTR